MSKCWVYPTTEPKILTNTTADYYIPRGSVASRPTTLIKNFRNLFPETECKIRDLYKRPEDWDGYGAAKPNPASVAHALSWAEQLYRDVRAVLWIKPHVSSDDEGDVSFEWWQGRRKLTVYVSPDSVEYIKVERTGDSSLEMEDGSIGSREQLRVLWNWLIS